MTSASGVEWSPAGHKGNRPAAAACGAERHNDCLVLDRQQGRLWVFWPGGQVGCGAALLPLRDGLLVDAVTPGQGPQAPLTMLYGLAPEKWRVPDEA